MKPKYIGSLFLLLIIMIVSLTYLQFNEQPIVSENIKKSSNINLIFPKDIQSPAIHIQGTLNPDYILITDSDQFRANYDGTLSAVINLTYKQLNAKFYTINIKVLDNTSKVVYSDIIKLPINKKAFIQSLINEAEVKFKNEYPYSKFVTSDYYMTTYDSSIWGIVSFITSDKIESTEIICRWEQKAWLPIAFGSIMEIRESFYSADIFKKLYDFAQWEKLISTKEKVAVAENFAKDRDSFNSVVEEKKQDLNSYAFVSFEELNNEFQKYVGANIKVSGKIHSISQTYTTTDLFLKDNGHLVHARFFKKIPFKNDEVIEIYGVINGSKKEVNLGNDVKKVISILAHEYRQQ